MISVADKRQTCRTRTRGVLGMLVIAWLNIAIQPCAMALGSIEDHDCPHCPPSHADEPSEHAVHGQHMAARDSASSAMPCATQATDCGLPDELNFDGRAIKLELKDAPGDVSVAVLPAYGYQPARRPARYHHWHGSRSPPIASSVPLNIYYCVYLK